MLQPAHEATERKDRRRVATLWAGRLTVRENPIGLEKGISQHTLPYPVAIGDKAPSFPPLLGVDGRMHSLTSFDGKEVLIIIFMANRCTTVQAYAERIEDIQRDYLDRGVQVVAINSDDPRLSPLESYSEMVRVAKERHYSFPYLKDEDQSIAKAYGAQLTLHVFLIDRNRAIRYRGRIDNSPNPAFVTTHDLRNALDDVLAGREVRLEETMPFPCGVDKYASCPSCGSRLVV